MDNNVEKWTPLQAFDKIKHYCSYQERCHYEVYQKLRQHGLLQHEAEAILSKLVEEDYLNEERFAIHYAGGHFRMKQWGKVKINYALKQKQVSAYCIKRALATIDLDDYEAVAEKLILAKWKSVGRASPAVRWSKTRNYMLQKGYESSMITNLLKHIKDL